MATKFTGGPEAGTFSGSTVQKSIFWIVLAVVGALVLIMLAIYFRSSTSSDGAKTEQGKTITPSSPTSGTFEANTVEWKGVTCMDPTKRLDMSILVDNVYVWIRLDKDDRRIYPLPPRNAPGVNHLEVPPFNTMEYKIPPGQKDAQGREITSAPVGWEISPCRKVASN